METKRLVLAVVLSVLIVFAWQFLGAKMGWIKSPEPPKAAQEAALRDPSNPASQNAALGGSDPFSAAPAAREGFTPQERETLVNLLLRLEANAKAMAKEAAPEEPVGL